MPGYAISKSQGRKLSRILTALSRQTEAEALVVMDNGGNILSQVSDMADSRNQTVAALAAGSFSATKELAGLLGEPVFKSIFHRGEEKSVYLHAITSRFLILMVLSGNTTQGLAKLYLERCGRQLETILGSTGAQSAADAGASEKFEIDENAALFGES